MTLDMGGASTGTREVLNKVLEVLEKGLRDITRARDTVIDTGKRNIADVSWIKVKDFHGSVCLNLDCNNKDV